MFAVSKLEASDSIVLRSPLLSAVLVIEMTLLVENGYPDKAAEFSRIGDPEVVSLRGEGAEP